MNAEIFGIYHSERTRLIRANKQVRYAIFSNDGFNKMRAGLRADTLDKCDQNERTFMGVPYIINFASDAPLLTLNDVLPSHGSYK